ncbi:MAG: hypothetical protein CM1200mP9_09530 [Gammaproteobacteria bacterium]|nr:MAG: hypothetical protein CM1200mP9_09530 [Gammaproteobacteria bacterium]
MERANFDAGDIPVPTMIPTDADNYFGESAFSQLRGHPWMRQEWNFHKPMQTGPLPNEGAPIEDIYKKRNRTLVNTAIRMQDSSGENVLTTNHHQSFLLDEPVDQGRVSLIPARNKAQENSRARRERLKGFEKTITLEMCGQYFPRE